MSHRCRDRQTYTHRATSKTVLIQCCMVKADIGISEGNIHTHTHPLTHTHTHTHIQLIYGSLDFVWDNPGELVPEETFTHSHLSWSSSIP